MGEDQPHASSRPLPSCAFQTGPALPSNKSLSKDGIPCRLSRIVFPGSVPLQIEFLKLTFGTTGTLKK